MKLLDRYIIRKFGGALFLTLALLSLVIVVFDVSEKVEDFIRKDIPLKEIIGVYYPNFLFYFLNLFSSLFVFISVIFFTSRLASNTEIVAMLASGVSFERIMRPYMFFALLLSLASYFLNGFVVPRSQAYIIRFDNEYNQGRQFKFNHNVQFQVDPQTVVFVESFDFEDTTGFRFTIEKFKDNKLVTKLSAERIIWQTTYRNWKLVNFVQRDFTPMGTQVLSNGLGRDTLMGFFPADFGERTDDIRVMNNDEFRRFVREEKAKGSPQLELYESERMKRYALPFSSLILTFIGFVIASRKVRGGTGVHILIGIVISFTYVVLMQFSTTFSISGGLPPWLGAWVPNIIYSFIGLYVYFKAPK